MGQGKTEFFPNILVAVPCCLPTKLDKQLITKGRPWPRPRDDLHEDLKKTMLSFLALCRNWAVATITHVCLYDYTLVKEGNHCWEENSKCMALCSKNSQSTKSSAHIKFNARTKPQLSIMQYASAGNRLMNAKRKRYVWTSQLLPFSSSCLMSAALVQWSSPAEREWNAKNDWCNAGIIKNEKKNTDRRWRRPRKRPCT